MYAKYVGTTPHILPDGRTLAPDEFVADVSADHPEIAPLLAEGRIIEVDENTFNEYASDERKREEPSRDDLLARAQALEIEGAGKGNLRTKDALKGAIAQREAEVAAASENADAEEDN